MSHISIHLKIITFCAQCELSFFFDILNNEPSIQSTNTDQEEETKEIIENGEDNNNATVSARPRRMSELPDPPTPILPIPEGSAFFILSQGNRCDGNQNRKK